MATMMSAGKVSLSTRIAYAAAISHRPIVNVALRGLGNAINKAGIKYETGKLRWKSILQLSNDPEEILPALKGLTGCKGKDAKAAVESYDLKKPLQLWGVPDPQEVISTFWDYGYTQSSMIGLIHGLMGAIPRHLSSPAISALPAAIRAGYSRDEILNFFGNVVDTSEEHSYLVFYIVNLAMINGWSQTECLELCSKVVNMTNGVDPTTAFQHVASALQQGQSAAQIWDYLSPKKAASL